ncbi:MAG TPA: ATP-binding protein [Ktedonobacterales bacterium]|nr:ATP-binding protein [Ktedonobacterales bacterium]
MDSVSQQVQTVAADRLFPGNSEMARLMRAMDWSRTPLGPLESWSPTLRMMVPFLLANRFPLLLWWGPEFLQLYNDAYRPVLGTKHPQYLGRSVRECWSEIWDVIGPLIATPFSGGPATWSDDIFLEVYRHGFTEETHFTIAYSPVPDETAPNGIGGVLATVHEISAKVVGERRVEVLRDLGARAAEAKTAEEACRIATETLSQHPKDLPFALLYLIDPDGKHARLAATAGVRQDSSFGPPLIALDTEPGMLLDHEQTWPLAEAMRTETMQVVEGLATRFGEVPPGPWSDPPTSAVVMPIHSNIAHQLAGFLVAGVTARLRLDDTYAGCYELVGSQIATAIANARAYEEERKRAEALAAIDRAKTIFFSNVSHEFRTPLTLLLNPIEDGLADPGDPLSPAQRARQEIAYRNALRLLKLVNTLLDFSRIEAGRIHATYEPTDLAAYTTELASVFRSAVERAGLRFIVDCPPLPDPVYVDREMWEKIVLNLLSNALKFTLAGEIAVTLRQTGDAVELNVCDTGVGIPAAELPHLFERFHRVQNTHARTQEGTGIGLALVRELVDLHGGDVRVASVPGAGSTFTVAIPTGAAHLPPEHIVAAPREPAAPHVAAPYVEEALRWLPDDGDAAAQDVLPPCAERLGGTALRWSSTPAPGGELAIPTVVSPASGAPPARILLADDNADMRAYLTRLLSPHWAVEAVPDGATALAVARERPPDLVLSDVMMPSLDGFTLLRALRTDEHTRTVPVMLLSARAGEEAAVEGLQAGADDYLVKPFTARELLARVAARLELTRLRREAAQHVGRLDAVIEAIADAVFIYDAEGRITWMNSAARQMFALDSQPEYASLPLEERMRQVHPRDEHGRLLAPDEMPQRRALRGEVLEGPTAIDIVMRALDGRDVHFNQTGGPVRDAEGTIVGAVAVCRDVTEQRRLEQQLRWQASMLERAHDAIFIWELGGPIVYWNQGAEDLYGFSKAEAIGRSSHELLRTLHPASQDDFEQVLEREGEWTGELTHTTAGGRRIVVSSRHQLLREADGRHFVLETSRDITEKRRLEQQTRAALEGLLAMAETLVRVDERALGSSALDSNVNPVAQRLLELMLNVLGCRRSAIIALEPGTDVMRPVAMLGLTPEQEAIFWAVLPGTRIRDYLTAPAPFDRLIADEVVVLGERDVQFGDQPDPYGVRALLLAPMCVGERFAGVLVLDFDAEEHAYTADELALARAVAKLAALVIERDWLLREREEASVRELAQSETNRRMEEFLGIAGHELKTPVTVIKANVQLMSRAGQLTSREADLLHRSERQVDRLSRLVEDLLDVSRIGADKLELDHQPADLMGIIRDIVEGQRLAHPDRDITLKLPRRDAVTVLADTDRIGQVLTNYLTNALKYSVDDRPVAVSLQVRDHMARVSVRDEGPGISAAEQPHIWEPFHRVAGIEVQSGSGVGLGLGLHISRTIVERHGGQVGVESVPRQGSTFWFTLPITQPS